MKFEDLDNFANGMGDILWLILGGLIFSIAYFLVGIGLCCTIIGIPAGMQMFKIGKLCFRPFGYEVDDDMGLGEGCLSLIFNIIWLFVCGIELALMHLTMALLCGITIVLIPFAIAHLRLAWLALLPFGKSIHAA